MIKKDITFPDLDGNQVTETFWFHFSKVEVAELEVSDKSGSLSNALQQIIKEENKSEIFRLFKEIMTKAVGVRGADGRKFLKTPEAISDLMDTEAFSELFVEFLTKPAFAAQFIEGILPSGVDLASMVPDDDPAKINLEKAQETLASMAGPSPILKQVDAANEAYQAGLVTPASFALGNMSQDQLNAAVADYLAKEQAKKDAE